MRPSSATTDADHPPTMRPAILPTRERILQSAYALFRYRGYARVSVDVIAEEAGVTKRTFYYHFRSKDDLLADVVGIQSDLATAHLRSGHELMPADAAAFIDELFKELSQPSGIAEWTAIGFTKIALELAHLPGHPARAIARRHKVEMEGWLAGELRARSVQDPADAASEIMLLLEGCLSLILIHGDTAYADRAARAAKALVSKSFPVAELPAPSLEAPSVPSSGGSTVPQRAEEADHLQQFSVGGETDDVSAVGQRLTVGQDLSPSEAGIGADRVDRGRPRDG